jgi:hypothetical protein
MYNQIKMKKMRKMKKKKKKRRRSEGYLSDIFFYFVHMYDNNIH